MPQNFTENVQDIVTAASQPVEVSSEPTVAGQTRNVTLDTDVAVSRPVTTTDLATSTNAVKKTTKRYKYEASILKCSMKSSMSIDL